jgi:circadian clock protein KaiB
MTEIHFTLYISGRTRRSEAAIANLRRLGEDHLGGEYELVVIDAMENPEAAETDRILATPTLIKTSPLPRRRITGDLSDPRQVLTSLALPLEGGSTTQEEKR